MSNYLKISYLNLVLYLFEYCKDVFEIYYERNVKFILSNLYETFRLNNYMTQVKTCIIIILNTIHLVPFPPFLWSRYHRTSANNRNIKYKSYCPLISYFQGPSIIGIGDWAQVAEASHRDFFARKFPTSDTQSAIRERVGYYQTKGYYDSFNKFLSKQCIRHLLLVSMKSLSNLWQKNSDEYKWLIKAVDNWDGTAMYKYRVSSLD